MEYGNKYIMIGRPYIEKISSEIRLCAQINLQGKKEVLWFSVEQRYGRYFSLDRADAFVVGILTTAMHSGMDIICEGAITRRLLYQLNHYLIPMMVGNMEGYHPIRICADALDIIPECADAVATGWTGGVDSMYTLMRSLDSGREKHKLTHLMIANNGALEGKNTSALLKRLVQRAEKNVAVKWGFDVIGIDSNLQKLFPENFLAVASFRHAAVVLALQGLFGVFLCSSAYEFSKFSFDFANGFYYEFVSFACFETDCTKFYSAYGAYSRVQKLKALSEFPFAQEGLHPCIYALGKNCGRCDKCIRTEAALYGLGTLDKFSKVFDVDAFEQNRDWYVANVLVKKGNQHFREALELIQKRENGEISENAKRMARIMHTANIVVKKNQERLADKLTGE